MEKEMSISKYLKKNMDIDGKSEEMIFFQMGKNRIFGQRVLFLRWDFKIETKINP